MVAIMILKYYGTDPLPVLGKKPKSDDKRKRRKRRSGALLKLHAGLSKKYYCNDPDTNRFSDEVLNQDQIAELAGISQASVSRRISEFMTGEEDNPVAMDLYEAKVKDKSIRAFLEHWKEPRRRGKVGKLAGGGDSTKGGMETPFGEEAEGNHPLRANNR